MFEQDDTFKVYILMLYETYDLRLYMLLRGSAVVVKSHLLFP